MRHLFLPVLILFTFYIPAFAEVAPWNHGKGMDSKPSASAKAKRVDLEARTNGKFDTKRWKALNKSTTNGYWFYDSKTVKKAGNKAEAWTTLYPPKGNTKFLEGVYSNHEKIDKVQFVTIFSCPDGKYVQSSHTAYNWEGKKLGSVSISEKDYRWDSIEPNSSMTILYNIACRPAKNK